jgi:hypothetical protein
MLDGGIPTKFAHICLPTENDIKQWRQSGRNWKGLNEITEQQLIRKQRKQQQQQQQPKSTLEPCRTVIGYVVDGFFSMIRALGYGLGFCTAESILQLSWQHKFQRYRAFTTLQTIPVFLCLFLFFFRSDVGFVLIRNAESPFYRVAVLAIHFKD